MSNSLHHDLEPASTGSTVDHIEHVEDMPILRGAQGARIARTYLDACLRIVAGESHPNTRVTTKFDGSVSIIAGYDPADGLFFVAKKSIFNKVPVYYKSQEEIMQTDLRHDLKVKFLWALRFLPDVIKDGIFQGDYLYSIEDVKFGQLRGRTSFQPNTLIYSPRWAELRSPIANSMIGIAWHTQYEGTIGNLRVTTKYPMPKSSANVICIDCTIDHLDEVAGNANTLMSDETYWRWVEFGRESDEKIEQLASHLDALSKHREFPKLFKLYQNARAKGCLFGFGYWVWDYFEQEANKRKTPRGKNAVKARCDEIYDLITRHRLNDVMRLIANLEFMKHYMIKELDNHSDDFVVYYQTKDGEVHETGHEGYVVTWYDGTEPVKIVDRKQFSFLNFSSEVKHGWER